MDVNNTNNFLGDNLQIWVIGEKEHCYEPLFTFANAIIQTFMYVINTVLIICKVNNFNRYLCPWQVNNMCDSAEKSFERFMITFFVLCRKLIYGAVWQSCK
mgnify:CR=1 FL=1